MKTRWILAAFAAVCAIALAGCKVVSESSSVAVESVTLNVPTLALTPDMTEKLTATVKPDNADNKTVTWSSSDETVATVSDDGTVKAIKAGEATITAKAGDKTATCKITVKLALVAVESVSLGPASLTLTRGDKGKLTATVTPEEADNKTVTWSSSDPAVATVSEDGTVTAVKTGEAKITAQVGGKTAECKVTVNPILVTGVALNETTLTLTRGETGKLAATVVPEEVDNKTITWSSSDPAIATVDNNGTATAVGKGTATITAQVGDKTATCTVTVKQAVESVTLEPTSITLSPNRTGKLVATVKPDDADDKTVTWSSSNPEVATVGSDGTVTAVKKGTATITAKAGGKQATCAVTVHTEHSYSGGSCTCGFPKPTLEYGEIDDNGVLTRYIGSETYLVIPDGVTKIAEMAFYDNKSLEHVVIPGSVDSIGNSSDYGAFEKCSNLKSVIMGEGVTSIGLFTFKNCTSLNNMMIPNSVTSIGISAFEGCTSLTNMTIPDSVTSIGFSTFRECTGLTSVTIPDSVTSIGSYAFYHCSSLKSVTIPYGVKTIEDSTFRRCESLASVTIPVSVTSIGFNAFYGCESLASVTIPANVTRIGSNAFEGCTNLTIVTIPNRVYLIGEYAFSGCTGLTSVTIPTSVTDIKNNAFEKCKSLVSVNYTGTEAKWNAITKGEDWDSDTGSYTITYNYKQ